MPEGCVSASALSVDTHPRESPDLLMTLWLAGRGVYRSADDGYGGQSRAVHVQLAASTVHKSDVL